MKSSEAEQARRVNLTLSLIRQPSSNTQVLEKLISLYGLSRRQAYRYLLQAQQVRSPIPVPEAKAVFTVKLTSSLISQVRKQARQECCSISQWVEHALRLELDATKGHG